MDLSPDQSAARVAVLSWFKSRKTTLLTLGGYAGSGKDTAVPRADKPDF